MKNTACCIVLNLVAIASGSIDAAQRQYLDANGVKLYYTAEGRGTSVLLIHGYAEDATRAWRDTGVAKTLLEAGFRVVMYDNRGHGRSEKPHTADKYGMEMVRDVVQVLDYLEIERAHVVGYSMGAAIANKLREQHPDRLLSVTLAGYGEPPTPEQYTRELQKEIEMNLRRMGLHVGNDAKALSMLTASWSEWAVSAENMRRNRVPALAVIGEKDGFLGDTQRLAEMMSTLRLEVIPGDHGTARIQPEFVNSLLRFLRAK